MTGPFEPHPRRHHLRGMTAGIVSASPEDEKKLEAKIVAEIHALISDPIIRDKALQLARERIDHISPVEVARIVAALALAEVASNNEGRNSNEGVAHYRDDGTYVDEHGNVETGMSRGSEFMPSANNIFYSQTGKLKSYDEGWDAWTSRYGKGELGNTGFLSHDVYAGIYYGKKYYPGHAGLQKLFAISEIAAQQRGAEISAQDGKKAYITPEQIKTYIDQHQFSDAKAQQITADAKLTAQFESDLHREVTISKNANPDSPENKVGAQSMTAKALKLEQLDFNNLPTIQLKNDTKQYAVQAQAKTPSPAP